MKGDEKNVGLWIDFIPQKVYEELPEGERKDLLDFQKESYKRRRKQSVIDRLEKEIEDRRKRLEKFKRDIKDIEKEEKDLYQLIFHLGSKIEPNFSIYITDETSKSVKGSLKIEKSKSFRKYNYKSVPLKERKVIYCMVKHSTSKKNLYLGGEQKMRKILSDFYKKDFSIVTTQQLKNSIRVFIVPYLKYHLQNGISKFIDENHPFEKRILPWIINNPDIYNKFK
jgi:hypothetical protein